MFIDFLIIFDNYFLHQIINYLIIYFTKIFKSIIKYTNISLFKL